MNFNQLKSKAAAMLRGQKKLLKHSAVIVITGDSEEHVKSMEKMAGDFLLAMAKYQRDDLIRLVDLQQEANQLPPPTNPPISINIARIQ